MIFCEDWISRVSVPLIVPPRLTTLRCLRPPIIAYSLIFAFGFGRQSSLIGRYHRPTRCGTVALQMTEGNVRQIEEFGLRVIGLLPRFLVLDRQIVYAFDPLATAEAISVIDLPIQHAE